MNTAIAYPLKLPFINYVMAVNSKYADIANAVKLKRCISFDKEKCASLWKDIQDLGVYTLLREDAIFIYKDFVKQKPSRLDVYYAKSTIESDGKVKNVMNICLDIFYDTNKLHHVVFYRYLMV